MVDSELIGQCRALLAAGEHEQAVQAAHGLESAMPATQAEWRDLFDLFTSLRSTVWPQVMTDRFLAVAPDNVAAHIVRATYLCGLATRKAEAKEAVETLAQLAIVRAEDWLTLSTLSAQCGLHAPVLDYIKTALALAPANASVKIMATHRLINLRQNDAARAEIAAIRSLAGESVPGLVAATLLALRLDDQALAADTMAFAIAHLPPGDHTGRARLIPPAAQLIRRDYLATLVSASDFTQVDQLPILMAAYAAFKGRGFFAQERSLVGHALTLSPDDAALQEAARQQKEQFTDFFPAPGPELRPPAGGVLGRLRRIWQTQPS